MRTSILVVALLVLVLAGSTPAFDNHRKGFVLGGGLGITPWANWKGEPVPSFLDKYEETGTGVGGHLIIGYGFDDVNILVFNVNGTAYPSDLISGVDITISQGFGGVTWYHYFPTQRGGAFFTALGVGRYAFGMEFEYQNFKVEGHTNPGFGMLGGAGYEFGQHWQVGMFFSAGNTSEPYGSTVDIDYEHAHFSVLASYFAY
jgi:hypothetical protein